MHVMGGGDVGGAKTQIMNTVTGLAKRNEVMLISFRAGRLRTRRASAALTCA